MRANGLVTSELLNRLHGAFTVVRKVLILINTITRLPKNLISENWSWKGKLTLKRAVRVCVA